MTSEENSRIRLSLINLSTNPVVKYKRPIKSPYSSWSFASSFRTVSLAVLTLLVASTGVSFAAEGTLPGDLLYPIKVNVNEEVRGALTTNSEDKMNWEKERVVLRVVETETLIKNNQFTDKRKTQAETALKTQMETFATAASKTSEKNPSAVISATAELEPALKVHQKVIAEIATTASIDTKETDSILATVATGITNANEQESVAINSSVTNQPDKFALLTDAKINGAELAIDASILSAESDLAKEAEKDNTEKANTEKNSGDTTINQDLETKETTVSDPNNLAEKNTGVTVTTPAPSLMAVIPDPKIETKAEVKTETESKTSLLKTLPLEEAKTAENSKIISSKEVGTATQAEVSAKSTTSTTAKIEIDPKEVLAKARIKLEQSKKLRDEGKFKEALTLAQEAYKDTVGLKIQAQIVAQNKAEAVKVEIKAETTR